MNIANQTKFAILLLALTALGCRAPLPCPDCDEVADEHADPTPDLPCGGADFQTDSYNCGACGNECPMLNPDTDYTVGQCNAGECGGPYWYEQLFDPLQLPPVSCDEVCAGHSRTCVERGCSGKTGFMCGYLFQEGCLNTLFGITDWFGPCAEPVEWHDPDINDTASLHCCCE
jgi:hypothetical protein